MYADFENEGEEYMHAINGTIMATLTQVPLRIPPTVIHVQADNQKGILLEHDWLSSFATYHSCDNTNANALPPPVPIAERLKRRSAG